MSPKKFSSLVKLLLKKQDIKLLDKFKEKLFQISKKSKYYGILTDEGTDISNKSLAIYYAQY